MTKKGKQIITGYIFLKKLCFSLVADYLNMEDIERTLLVKPEVFIYKIPPRSSAKGYRAADWKLDAPDWTVRLRVLVKGSICEIRLDDRNTGELFAACPVEHYPGTSVEAVTDSSRYFVICVQSAGNKAYLGMGFTDRSDSFDLNVTLQDHFKQLKKEDQFCREAIEDPKPNLDLAFKEGQTIRINIPGGAGGGAGGVSRPRGASSKAGGIVGGILPPPPTGNVSAGRVPASVSSGSLAAASSVISTAENTVGDLLGDFAPPVASSNPQPSVPNPSQNNAASAAPSSGFSAFDDDMAWGDFSTTAASSGNWTSFN